MASHPQKKENPRRSSPVARPPGKRKYLLLLLPYAAVLFLLWIVNIALPRLDPTLDLPFTRETQLDGRTYLEINRGYLEPFFPAGSPMIPELKNSLVHPAKGPRSLRVLCLGESSMFGVPFAFAATIPTLVRKQLRHLYPDLDIEVVNLAASAINTNVIREMVPQYLSLEPDLVLIYTGHNEFYGPDGIGASWLERQFLALTPWKYRARRLPLVSWLQRKIADLGDRRTGTEGNLMRQVSDGAEVPLESPETERIFGRFQENLRDIVHAFQERNIPLVLGEVSSNLMFPPFAPRPAAVPDLLAEAVSAGRVAIADSLLATPPYADSLNAYALYWRGRLSLAQGKSGNAAHLLERARDHDLLKFRAPGRINRIIHEVGDRESIPVLAIDSLLRARSPHGITDSMFFSEHLHPTFYGYDQIARMFVQAIVDRRLVQSSEPAAASLLPFNADSLSVPWLDLGVGALGLRALTTRWPFTEMPRRQDVLDTCEEWEWKLATDVYGGGLGWTDGLLQYAQKAKEQNRMPGMVRALSALVEEYPERPVLRYGLAGALQAVGRRSEALGHYRRAVALQPGLAQPTVDFAFLLIEDGEYEEAQHQLQALVTGPARERTPTAFRAMALYGLAIIAANSDSIPSALQLVDESLRLAPGYEPALMLKSEILQNTRQ